MAYKQKSWSAFTRKTDPPKKTYPKHYTADDIKFLEEQNEDIVREEDKVKPTFKELNENPNVRQQIYIGKKRIGSFKPKKKK